MSLNNESLSLVPKDIITTSRYLLPLLIFFGNLSCLLSLVIFLQKSMQKNPSGLYFLSFTISNVICINITIVFTMFIFTSKIDPDGDNIIQCRLLNYVVFVSSLLSTSFLVLVSIDRFLITSTNVSIKRFSSRSVALKLIMILIIFSCVIHIHVFFFIGKKDDRTKISLCRFSSDLYGFIISWYMFVVFGLLTPLFMIIFGIRTIVNVRHVMINSVNRLYSIDRQLIIMMLSQCFVHVVFRLPLPTYLIYNYVTRNERSFLINIYFFYIATICFLIPHCTFFFVNLIGSSFRIEFRRLVKKFFMKKLRQLRRLRKHRRHRINPLGIVQQQIAVEMTPVQI